MEESGFKVDAMRFLTAISILCTTALNALGTPLHAPDLSQSSPNIIYILADDLGYGDLGCYGQQSFGTPHLDRMASQGMRFTDHYAGSTVCAPSRCTLMTGLHQGHARIRGNKENQIEDEDLTVAEVLKTAGYKTALIGKWGLGEEGTPGEPSNQGFDYYYGYLNQIHAHNHFPAWLIRNGEKVALDNSVKFRKVNYGPELGSASTEKNEYTQTLFTEDALRFIEESRNEAFFLYLAFVVPHTNNEGHILGHHGMEVPDQGVYANKDWPDEERCKAAMISMLDADVGKILDYLEASGLAENTLVVFSSDNGPHMEGVDPEFFASNGPLKGIKRDMYDGGIRVPMIAWWPGTIGAGTVSGFPSAFYDMMPTFADLAGASIPDGKTDGISLLPTLLGRSQDQAVHDYLYWEFKGTRPSHMAQVVRSGDWKLLHFLEDDRWELYNVRDDLNEDSNQFEKYPELVKRMQGYMKQAHVPHPVYPLPID